MRNIVKLFLGELFIQYFFLKIQISKPGIIFKLILERKISYINNILLIYVYTSYIFNLVSKI